jgi:hypothetical protein
MAEELPLPDLVASCGWNPSDHCPSDPFLNSGRNASGDKKTGCSLGTKTVSWWNIRRARANISRSFVFLWHLPDFDIHNAWMIRAMCNIKARIGTDAHRDVRDKSGMKIDQGRLRPLYLSSKRTEIYWRKLTDCLLCFLTRAFVPRFLRRLPHLRKPFGEACMGLPARICH